MKNRGSRVASGLALLLALALALPGPGRGQAAAYLDHDGLTRELRSIVNNSGLASMESLATTFQGREVWMVTVADPSGPPPDQRPGVLVVGNLEGDHLVGSHLALEAVRYLVANASAEAVGDALASRVFYIFPRLNPDGAEAMFEGVRWARRGNGRPVDDDNDGRTDEDGPQDLNGDGFITVMRVADPAGEFMIHPDNDRLMKRADHTEGESGSFTLYWEGTDEDGDGFINEDGPGGVDLNRNFQHAYPYWQADAGPYMVSEAESRAIMDFVLAHTNIAGIVAFGETDNLVTPPTAGGTLAPPKVLDLPIFAQASNADVFDVGVFGGGGAGFRRFGGFGGFFGGGGWLRGAQPGRDNDPSSGRRPATTVNADDVVYFEAVSEAYKEITGIETVPVHREPEGAFFQFGYFQYGVPSFSTPGWSLPEGDAEEDPAGEARAGPDTPEGPPSRGARPAGARMAGGMRPGGVMAARQAAGRSGGRSSGGAGADADVLAALESAGIDAFADWTPFQHPELGEVEIGGFLPYATVNPPTDQLPELGEKHGAFLVELAGMLPRVGVADTEVTAHGGGVFTVTAAVENTGFFPTSLRHGQISRAVGPTFLQIQVDADDILTGADKTAYLGVLDGSGGREEVTWVIRGREGSTVEIRLHSMKSGRDTRTITLR